MRRSITAADLALRGRWAPTGALALATIGRILGGIDDDMTVFDDRLGENNGRVAVGDGYAFVLGSHWDGATGRLTVGDRVQVTQTVDVTDDIVLRAELTMRTPVMPAGLAWQASLILDDVVQVATLGWPGRTRQIKDLAIPVSHLVGPRVFGVRLALVESA